MQPEKKLLTKKRKSPEESTKDSSDEYTLNKKSKSISDTYSDEHYLKMNTKFINNESIKEVFNEKNVESILIPEEDISIEKYNIGTINSLEDNINTFSDEPKELLNFTKFIVKVEYDYFPFVLMKYILKKLEDFNKLKEDYTYYIYNNLKPLLNDKQFIEVNKNIAYNRDNELFFKSFNEFSNFRWTKFISAAEKYNINLLKEYKDSINFQQRQKKQNDKFDTNKVIDAYKNCPEENQIETLVAALVYNSKKNFEQRERDEQNNILDKNSIIKDTLEIQNFNLGEMAMISVLDGIKFNINIVEINLCGNSLSPKSCFWLGTCLKTLPYLSILDISQTNLDNDKLYMFYEGMIFYCDEKMNKKQFILSKLNLKDNPNITDNNLKNNNYEHPIPLILKKCKLKILNLTNVKIGGNGAKKLFLKMTELLEKNKLFLGNLILISNNIYNEECLITLGEFLKKKNCPLKKLILSKNLISTYPEDGVPSINYFEKLMKSMEQSQLEELFLLNCNLGNDVNDLNIIYEMLKNNKSLTSLRLFGNKICDMKFFAKILGIFSDYNKPLENNKLQNLDLSKNNCHLIIDDNFMKMIENLKLKYLDINQNYMKEDEKEIFMKKTYEMSNIRIIY